MLPLTQYPEPDYFDREIRQKGNNWLALHPQAKSSKYPAYWTKCLDDLHELYDGICAYYSIYIEIATDNVSVDHFLPKSKYRAETYEWHNYRFASQVANRAKKDAINIYDPFLLPEYSIFHIDFSDGAVIFAQNLLPHEHKKAERTIEVLKLNSKRMCKMRMKHLSDYWAGKFTSAFLKEQSPFVWAEANRQGLL